MAKAHNHLATSFIGENKPRICTELIFTFVREEYHLKNIVQLNADCVGKFPFSLKVKYWFQV